MTKIEELKAAYEAATPGEWDFVVADNAVRPFCSVVQLDGDGYEQYVVATTNSAGMQEQEDAAFIALAHNLMPQLLEAVELLKDLRHYDFDMCDVPAEGTYERELYDRLGGLMEKLK